MTYSFTVGGVPMQFPIMLGGGVCKFVHQLDLYLRSDLPVGALEIGSFTPELREGNPGSPQWPETYEELRKCGFGLNAWSMPNEGFKETSLKLAEVQTSHPLVVNIAGFAPTDFVEGVKTFEALPNVAATTLNFGCPNTENIPIAYDLNSIKAILDELRLIGPEKPVWVKLSPYITKADLNTLTYSFEKSFGIDTRQVPTVADGYLQEVLTLLLDYSFVKAVILTNTLGNVMVYPPVAQGSRHELPALSVNNNKGGLSGDMLRKHIVLPLITEAFSFIGNYLDIIACGGVFDGDHILEYFNVGAKGVQCVSGPIWNGGPRFFQNLITDSNELQEYLTNEIPG
jgi:dihydroorotate dehydrogenase